MTTTENEPEAAAGDPNVAPLSSAARYEVSVNTSFPYRGHTHWMKVSCEDTIGVLGEDPDGDIVYEDAEDLIARVNATVHYQLERNIERFKAGYDARALATQAARTSTES
jgi:hypothetical protein